MYVRLYILYTFIKNGVCVCEIGYVCVYADTSNWQLSSISDSIDPLINKWRKKARMWFMKVHFANHLLLLLS